MEESFLGIALTLYADYIGNTPRVFKLFDFHMLLCVCLAAFCRVYYLLIGEGQRKAQVCAVMVCVSSFALTASLRLLYFSGADLPRLAKPRLLWEYALGHFAFLIGVFFLFQ